MIEWTRAQTALALVSDEPAVHDARRWQLDRHNGALAAWRKGGAVDRETAAVLDLAHGIAAWTHTYADVRGPDAYAWREVVAPLLAAFVETLQHGRHVLDGATCHKWALELAGATFGGDLDSGDYVGTVAR